MSEPSLPAPVGRLVDRLVKLPGVGRKSALRMALHLLSRPASESLALGGALQDLVESIAPCGVCGHFTDIQPCRICNDPHRDPTLLCVVEGPMDLLGIERCGFFRGRYHVLGGALNPLAGVGPEDLSMSALQERLNQSDPPIREIIAATNPTPEGDATAAYIRDRIAPPNTQVTRIAYGLPQGGDLEFLDGMTIRRALENRRPT